VLQVLVLGTVRVAGADGFVDAGPAKQSCVLAALALNAGRPVTIETLVDRVWGDNPPRSCRATLYQYLSRLRGLGLTIDRTGAGYLLDVSPDQVDLHRARSLAAEARAAGDLTTAARRYGEALALWRGTPLGGLGGDWAATARDTLVREHLTLLGERFDAELALGRHVDVVAELSTVVNSYPLAERLAGQLMLALVRCGRAAEALECFTQTRQRVRDQLGVEPGSALRELHERILRQDPDLLKDEAPRSRTPRQMPADIPTFAGRHTELAALDRLTHAVDTPRAVVISAVSGTAGVGKTALAVHWAHRVAGRFPTGSSTSTCVASTPAGG
jgi:DNA-binding SARP family transcriptional activator